MDILLVAATPFEISPALTMLEQDFNKVDHGGFEKNNLHVQVLITGVGIMHTAWALGRSLPAFKSDLVINAGVAGAFDRSLSLGAVVQVRSDRFGDLGVEEADGRFTDVFELGLEEPNAKPFINGVLYNPEAGKYAFLPAVSALTVNRVHGSATSIEAIQKKYPDVQIETMEGAAFCYACLQAETPFICIRSLSNYVEPRNRDAWKLDHAIESLNTVLIEMLQTFTGSLPAP